MNLLAMIKDLAIPPGAPDFSWTLDKAQAYCKDLATTHYENFTVGSLFIPRTFRQHMYNVYAFCRISDDLGDETGDRQKSISLLEAWEKQLDQCYEGITSHPVFIALEQTIQKFSIPKEPFWRLIQAFKQDQLKTRYQTFEELLGYCRYSANPVGHLVLYLFGYRDEPRQKLSNFTCTALQLANFWQDVARDYAIGRIYLPIEDMEKFNVTDSDIANQRTTMAFKTLLDFEIKRTREMFYQGLELVRHVQGILKVDLEAFTQGGLAILNAIEKIDYQVLKKRPTVTRMAKLKILASIIVHTLFKK